MAKGQKGGNFVSALWTGTAFFAASRAKTFTGFLGDFLKYAIIIVLIMLAFWMVLGVLGVARYEGFMVPVKPSAEGDEKLRTPAGNVIMY
jgi:hypothetical protein